MKKLKTILRYNCFYYILVISCLIYSVFYLSIPKNSIININNDSFEGMVTNIKISGDLLTIEIENNEKIIGNYYFKTLEEKNNFINNFELGDIVYIKGSFKLPNNNTVFNLFNYKKYLERKNVFYLIDIENIEKISNNNSLFYKVKNIVINHINKYKTSPYLHTFILGNNDYLDSYDLTNYQENGISHLLAISGMHVSLLSTMILLLLSKFGLCEIKSYFFTIVFLTFYMFLSGNTASVSRSVLLFSFLIINKLCELKIKTLNIFLLVFSILVFLNPNLLFDVGFQFSFTVSFYLILFKEKLKSDNYIIGLFKVSIISFLVSLPISIYYFYQVNLFSVIFNMIFVPFVSFIVFPLSLITFFIPILDNLFLTVINVMEYLSFICSRIKFTKIIFGKPDLFWIFLYYLFITLFLFSYKKKYMFLICLILFIQYYHLVLFPKLFMIGIDIGQGDSLLFHSNNKTMLIDTGGKVTYEKEKWQQRNIKSITDNKLVPLFKSIGIKKIDYLILTHGDFDHMGEAINLVNNFKVEKVIFNCGEFNDLEQDLIKVLDKKKIKYYSCIKELNIDNNKLYFLQTKEYDNENDNSNVIYMELNGYKFMFMGDASTITEKEIIDKYNLPDIDVLKVGHHGSKTSSSKEFINEIEPRYSIISVGKNNRYGHPNKEVLNNLDNSKIYRTDQDGSIMFKIKNNKLRIETCSP